MRNPHQPRPGPDPGPLGWRGGPGSDPGRLAAFLAAIITFACPALAGDFSLTQPIDCVLGETCYIQQYMDRDPGKDARDFMCQSLSYDGHKGTDFALPSLAAMEAGVNVLAAADGVVRGKRDGMPDRLWSRDATDTVEGRECGNGVVLAHPGGWETQYCHLRQGSVTVRTGDKLPAGTVLGQVGVSGRTQFPHLHLSLRKNGVPVDPFDPDGVLTCGAPDQDTLWADTPPYQPGGVVAVGITTEVPEFDAVKAGINQVTNLPEDAPALVVYGYLFGTRTDDVLRLRLMGPEGVVAQSDTVLTRNHAQSFRAAGHKRRMFGRWPAGQYTGSAALLRDGTVVSQRKVTVRIEP